MRNIAVNMGVRYDKVALIEDNKLIDFYAEDHAERGHSDSIYFGVVADSVKKFESVFVNIGEEKNAYLQLDNTDKLPSVGEKILIQVIRDDTETKGVAVSKNLSLVGRYIVIISNNSGKNIPKSRVMFSNDFDKSKIKEIKAEFENMEKENGFDVIIRHEAESIDITTIKEEYITLCNKLKDIYEKFEDFKNDSNDHTPKLVYKKDIFNIVINEFYDKSVNEIVVDDEDAFDKIAEKMSEYKIDTNIVRKYDKSSGMSLFESYKIDEQLKKALGKYVWLKSGGQIVIEHTEALTVIDVNSSKYAGKKEIEESSLIVNIEAAKEIARQIRLRNISGIIIVDFINLKSEENKKKLIETLKTYVKQDKVKVNVLGMTSLGLVEMTRQKKRKMLKDIIKVTN